MTSAYNARHAPRDENRHHPGYRDCEQAEGKVPHHEQVVPRDACLQEMAQIKADLLAEYARAGTQQQGAA